MSQSMGCAFHPLRCALAGQEVLTADSALGTVPGRGNQWTALHIAAENAKVDVLRYLIEQQVDLNARDFDDETPMHCAAYWGHTEIVCGVGASPRGKGLV